jgi:hypothetical protein
MEAVVADAGGDPERPRTRRQLLKLAGGAALGGGALVLAGSDAAHAANGDNVVVGQLNTGASTTTIQSSSTVAAAFYADSTGGKPDIKLAGTGRLAQDSGLTGLAAPSWNVLTGSDASGMAHEIVRTSTGLIWASGGAAPADTTWKRVNAVRVDNPSGSGAAFAPFRLVNTIDGTGGFTGRRVVNTNTTYDAAGSPNLPDDTVAIFGNLAVVGPTFTGYIKIFPSGVATPGTSAINFTTNQTIANFFFLGLGTTGGNAGKFIVRPGGASSGLVHVVMDVTAYVQ